MSRPDPLLPWQRLTAAARKMPLNHEEAAPYGFATRAAACAWADRALTPSLSPQLSWRAFGVAVAVALATLAVNYEALAQQGSPEDVVLSADPVSAVVDLTSGL